MRVSEEFSHKAIGLMFMFALGVVIWKEWGSNVNPSKPLPRPCKLIMPTLGFTGIYIGASFAPSIMFWVALGLVVGEVVYDPGIFTAITGTLSKGQEYQRQAG